MAKLLQNQKKAVFISVYQEKPTKRKASSNHHHFHHHRHHVHHTFNNNKNGVKGYNRRAELLLYSQCLRQSANSSHPTQFDSNIHLPKPIDFAVKRKEEDKRTTPGCLGNWKILNLSFCKSSTSVLVKKGIKKTKNSGSARNNMKAFFKHIQLQKKRGFISKLLQKHR